jgi:hypothetical protein
MEQRELKFDNSNFTFFKEFLEANEESLGLKVEDFFEGYLNFVTLENSQFEEFKQNIRNKDIYKEKEEEFDRFLNIIEDSVCVSHFGGEGEGDNYYSVYFFPRVGMYIQFQGYYQSYNGSTYTDMYQVEPKEVTKIEYFTI